MDVLLRFADLSVTACLVLFVEVALSHEEVLNGIESSGFSAEQIAGLSFMTYLCLGEVVAYCDHTLLTGLTKLHAENVAKTDNDVSKDFRKYYGEEGIALLAQEKNQVGRAPVVNQRKWISYPATIAKRDGSEIKKVKIAIQEEIFNPRYATMTDEILRGIKEAAHVTLGTNFGVPENRLLNPYHVVQVLRTLPKDRRLESYYSLPALACLRLVLLYMKRLCLALSVVAGTGALIVPQANTRFLGLPVGEDASTVFHAAHTGAALALLAGTSAVRQLSLTLKTNAMNLLPSTDPIYKNVLLGLGLVNSLDLGILLAPVAAVVGGRLGPAIQLISSNIPYHQDPTMINSSDNGAAMPPDLAKAKEWRSTGGLSHVEIYKAQVRMISRDRKRGPDTVAFYEPQGGGAPFPVIMQSVEDASKPPPSKRTLPMISLQFLMDVYSFRGYLGAAHKTKPNQVNWARAQLPNLALYCAPGEDQDFLRYPQDAQGVFYWLAGNRVNIWDGKAVVPLPRCTDFPPWTKVAFEKPTASYVPLQE